MISPNKTQPYNQVPVHRSIPVSIHPLHVNVLTYPLPNFMFLQLIDTKCVLLGNYQISLVHNIALT